MMKTLVVGFESWDMIPRIFEFHIMAHDSQARKAKGSLQRVA